MNSLKKALTKDDVKRYQKKKVQNAGHLTKINQNSISNRNNWTDINQLIQCRGTYKKSVQLAVTQKIKSLLQKSFQQTTLIVSEDILVKSLQSIFDQYYPDQQFDFSRTGYNHNQQKTINLIELLEKVQKQQKQLHPHSSKNLKLHLFVQTLEFCIDLLKKHLMSQVSIRKEKQLNEFDKIISVLKPTKKKQDKKQQKRQNIQKLNKKLLNSLSSGNLHIKVTKEEIQIKKGNQKPEGSTIQRKKSEGNLNKVQSDKKLKSPKNEGHIKLENFLKDPNIKITKTKVEYDYNAILQGSKSNLQFRNKIFQHDVHPVNQSKIEVSKNNFEVTNINKAKKDQAFVFYRPKPSKNSNKTKQ